MKTASEVNPAAADIPADFRLDSYMYDLPEERIAQSPAPERGGSRLLLLDRATGGTRPAMFAEIGSFLPPEALLVVNNSRVLPARVFGQRPSGGRVEFLLLTPLPLLRPDGAADGDGWHSCAAEGLLRASKALRPGQAVIFGPDFRLEVTERGEFGRCQVRLFWTGDLLDVFERLGHLPLPPYIHRPDRADDRDRYQTIYADPTRTGSVAAPTAGLHFTSALRQELLDQGFGWAEVTLYVGYGTFSPVRCADIREHRMHDEYVSLDLPTAAALAQAKESGRPVVAVGTTSARTLEGAFAACEGLAPYTGPTDIFIYPGYRFQVVDHLITNFHLPGSSLMMMVSALAGREVIMRAYAEAMRQGFRFYSYGDSMFIR